MLPGLVFTTEMVMKNQGMVYVLKDRNGTVHRVVALTESGARAFVMEKKHGKIENSSFLKSTEWLGLGLDLVSVERRARK
jgi:hypothetical protein